MDGALIILDETGRYVDANEAALEMLGVTLEELRTATTATFSDDPLDPEQAVAFRAAWEGAGRPDITGERTIRRPDGSRIRVRFAITRRVDATYAATFEPVSGPVTGPASLRTVGDVLAAWREAERRLESLEPGTQEWLDAQDEVSWLRERHATVFRQRSEG